MEDIENKWRLLDNLKSFDIKYSDLNEIASATKHVPNSDISSVAPALIRQERQLPVSVQRSNIDQSHRNYWINLLTDEHDVP